MTSFKKVPLFESHWKVLSLNKSDKKKYKVGGRFLTTQDQKST